MRYQVIVQNHMMWNGKRVYYIYGGTETIRQDAEKIIRKIMKQTFGVYGVKPCVRYLKLKEVVDEPELLLYRGEYNLFFIEWEQGLLDVAESKQFFRLCMQVGARRHVVITNGDSDSAEHFNKVYPKNSKGVAIECVMPVGDKPFENYLLKKLQISKVDVTQELMGELWVMPKASLINIFNVLRYLPSDEFGFAEMEQMKLFRDNLEYKLSEELIEKGKNAVLRNPGLDDVNAKLFFGAVQMRLMRILTIKSSSESYGKQKERMKLPPDVFKTYWNFAKKFDLRILLERLKLLLVLRRYTDYQHSVLILLNHW